MRCASLSSTLQAAVPRILELRLRHLRQDSNLRPSDQKYTGPFDLPEPDDELRATIEKIVEHEVNNVPTR